MARITTPRKHKGTILIAQGTCTDNTKVTSGLMKPNGSPAGAGTPLCSASTDPRKKRSWAFLYRNLTAGVYQHTAQEAANTGLAISTDTACYTVDSPPPPPPSPPPPTITAPANGDTVAPLFFPYGTTAAARITQCLFADQNNNQYDAAAAGAVTGPDADGNWYATLDTTQGQPAAITGSNCTLTVQDSNGAGPSIVNNITVASTQFIAGAGEGKRKSKTPKKPASKRKPAKRKK